MKLTLNLRCGGGADLGVRELTTLRSKQTLFIRCFFDKIISQSSLQIKLTPYEAQYLNYTSLPPPNPTPMQAKDEPICLLINSLTGHTSLVLNIQKRCHVAMILNKNVIIQKFKNKAQRFYS